MNETTFENKCSMLAELWLNYRDDVEFAEYIEYCDLALPLAYSISNGIVESTDKAQTFIEEAWTLLLTGSGLTDNGYDNLDDLLSQGEG